MLNLIGIELGPNLVVMPLRADWLLGYSIMYRAGSARITLIFFALKLRFIARQANVSANIAAILCSMEHCRASQS